MTSPLKNRPDHELSNLLESRLSKIANDATLDSDKCVQHMTSMIMQTFQKYTQADQGTLFLLSRRRRGQLEDHWVEEITDETVIFRSPIGSSYNDSLMLDKLNPIGAGSNGVDEDAFMFEHIRHRLATDAIDVTEDARFKLVENKTANIHLWRAVPLITTNRMIGVVILSLDKNSDKQKHFENLGKDLLQLGGETAAEYLDAAFRKRNRETEHYILQKIAPLSKSDRILQNVCHALSIGDKRLRDTYDCTFFLRLENDQPYVVSWVDDEGSARGQHVFPTQPSSTGIGVTGNVFVSHKSRIVYDSKDTVHEHDYVPAETITPSAPRRQSVSDPRSLLVVPVLVEQRTIGVISIDSHEWANYNLYDRDLVESVAGQIATLIDRAITFEAAQAITLSIASSEKLGNILHDIVTQAEKLTSATRGAIIQAEDALQTIYVVHPPASYPSESLDDPFKSYTPNGAEEAFYKHMVELLRDEDTAYNPTPAKLKTLLAQITPSEKDAALNVTAVVAAPLRDEGRFIGAFILTSALRERFTQLEVDAVETFAGLAGLAISNRQRLKLAKANLDRLIDATRAGFGDMDSTSENSLNAIAEQARALVDATLCVIVRHNRNAKKLDFVAGAPYDILDEIKKNNKLNDIDLNSATRGDKPIGLIGRIILDRDTEFIYIPDTDRIDVDWPMYVKDHVPFVYKGLHARSEIAVPIMNRQNERIGAIEVEHKDPHAFSDNHIVLMRAFADLVAIAFEPNAGIAVRTKHNLVTALLEAYVDEQSNRGLRREEVVKHLIKRLYDHLAEQSDYKDIENIVVFPIRRGRTTKDDEKLIIDDAISVRTDQGYEALTAREDGITVRVFRERKRREFSDIQDYSDHNQNITSRGAVVLPLSVKYQDVGVIWFEFQKRKTAEFLRDPFFSRIAELIALVLASWRPEDVTRFRSPDTTRTYQSDIFVAFPFSKKGTLIPFLEDYAHSRGLWIENAAAHSSDPSTSFINEIWHYINNCEVVIADCTELYTFGDNRGQMYSNPNVFYEIAIAHMIGKPVILITEDGASSDIGDIDRCEYSLRTEADREKFREELDYRLLRHIRYLRRPGAADGKGNNKA